MIDNKTQVLLPRILLPLVSSTTYHFDSPSSFSSSISPFSSSPCSASLASPFFRFASLVSIWPFSPHCIVAFFYRCGDLFKLPPPPPRSFSFFSLTDPFAFSLLPPSLRSSSRSRQLFFLSSPLHSARCLLRCTPLGIRTSFRLMQHYDSVMSSFIFRGRSDEDGLLTPVARNRC